MRPVTAVAEPVPPKPSKFVAVTAVLTVDAEKATSLLAISACQAAPLAMVVAAPAAPGPLKRRSLTSGGDDGHAGSGIAAVLPGHSARAALLMTSVAV